MKKKIPLLAAALLPLLITLIICIDHEVFPFGKQCILHVDMYHQYCPFFAELMEKLKTGGSFFYSWNVGLGADFVSLYAYYLASPLNWFILLCPSGYVIEFMTILVVIKIALCGFSFAYYLKEHFKTNHFAIAIFGTAYALSAYMAAYAWNIMWTDCLVLAPLIILGLERLVKDGRPLLYYTMLSISILSNYYISLMICIFLIFWFLITWMENKSTGIVAWLRFAGYSILAGGTGAILIVPTAIVLGNSGAQGISFPESIEWYFHILAELARHFVMTESYTGQEHWPDIYCGVFVLLFVVLFVLNREIAWKRKLAYGLFAVLFVLSFANNILDFIWHGLHFPTSLPGRQSFLYIFLLLVMSFESFMHLRANRIWHILAAGVLNGIFLFVIYRFVLNGEIASEGVEMQDLAVTAILQGCYLIILLIYKCSRAKGRQWMLMLGAMAVLGELIINFDVTGLDTTSRSAYVENWKDYDAVLESVKKDTQQFYRTEELERKTKNDAALFGYASVTQFSSLMNLEVSHFYQDVGMEGGKNFYCMNGATPLLSAMLSIRYVIADNGYEENPMRHLAASSGNTYLYENEYVLPLGFMMDETVVENWNYASAGEIASQNELAYLLGADSQMLLPISSVSAPGEAIIEVDEAGYYFATYEKTEVDNLTMEVDSGRSRNYTKTAHGYTLDLGYCEAGDTIKIKNTENEPISFLAYKLDVSAFTTAFDSLSQQTLKIENVSDTMVAGSIKVVNPGRLIFSIANEEGWSLYVDGVEREKESFGGAFLSVYLEEGEHEIKLCYETPGFRMGAVITGASVAIFGLLMAVRKKKQFHGEK